jgi:hypothetical protein
MIATMFGGRSPFDLDDAAEAAGDGSRQAHDDGRDSDTGDEAA